MDHRGAVPLANDNVLRLAGAPRANIRLAHKAGGAHAFRAFPASLDPNDRSRPDAMSPRSSGPARQHASVETLTPISDARYPVTREWHALSPAEVAKLLSVNPDGGLSDTEARGRLARVGANVVGEHTETPLWRLALAQFRSLVVLLLLAASVIAAALGERVESVAILAALLLNAGIGFFTEWRARISLAKLRALTVPQALVRREGAIVNIRAAAVVPGDLLVLEAGAHVPADARLIRSSQLRTAEAALTGESVPVDKDADAQLAPETALADRRTMVYLGTTVVAGTGLAVVTATGFATELGRIGQLVALAGERATPLERQVEELGRRLIGFALATCGLVGLTASSMASRSGSCSRPPSPWPSPRSRRACRRSRRWRLPPASGGLRGPARLFGGSPPWKPSAPRP